MLKTGFLQGPKIPAGVPGVGAAGGHLYKIFERGGADPHNPEKVSKVFKKAMEKLLL